jgi:hypothetical protein
VPKRELYLGEVQDMHAAIIDSAPSYLRLEETRDHVRTALGLYESTRKGIIVRLAYTQIVISHLKSRLLGIMLRECL